MKQDRIDQHDGSQVQSQDPIGVMGGQSTLATDGRPQRDVASQSSFEAAWDLAH